MLLKSYQEKIPTKGNFLDSAKQLSDLTSLSDDLVLNNLYRNHSAELLTTILKIIPQTETAEDILQDTFVKVKRCIHSYNAERSQLLTWSKAIAKNMALDHLRLKSSRNSRLNQSIDFSQAELASKHFCSFNIDRIGLKQLFSVLSSEQLSILQLFYYEGYTHEEISEALDIPLGTIKTRIRMSIVTLRRFFN
ncbi:RNA polymerase sigma factor [Pedobacter mendelii]|uniref:RNA polymerase n=1 Tax=Pedobacter mendelii TaxID=1908240 RepID=A0ABQ2BL70_9SPHI|nr:sigma-70 family RNA polymerase sigma factor [Pedobacter mendelii]GGI26903.1 RNA polymerase [Pedobacter mendelii]